MLDPPHDLPSSIPCSELPAHKLGIILQRQVQGLPGFAVLTKYKVFTEICPIPHYHKATHLRANCLPFICLYSSLKSMAIMVLSDKSRILIENRGCHRRKITEVVYLITDIVSIHPFQFISK